MRNTVIIFIGIALIIASAIGLYFAYSGENAGSAFISWAGLIIGTLITLFGFGKRASDQMEKPPGSPAISQGQAEIRALIQCMGMVAVADKRVRESEVKTIGNIHEQMLGLKISDDEIHEILSEFSKDFDISARLKRDLDFISPTMRRTIIQSCHLVMVSDLEVVISEENRIYEIGEALGFTKSDVEDLIASAGI